MHKILLAEDDNDMRRFLVKALENAGFQVSPHDNGMSAYQRLREEPFEMLLTDIVMPEMDGIELARRASELDPDIKIMFITGFAAVALNSDSEAPKNAKVLSKLPVFHNMDTCQETVEKYAARKSQALTAKYDGYASHPHAWRRHLRPQPHACASLNCRRPLHWIGDILVFLIR